MATDLTQLINDVYDYFLGLYQKTRAQHAPSDSSAQPAVQAASAAQPGPSSAAESAFIAFESIGTPMTPDMFKLQSGDFDPGLILQQFTLRANNIPALNGATISAPGLLSVDGAYEGMLDAAQPLTAMDLDAFSHTKSSAKKTFDEAAGNFSISGLSGQFHPAVPSPTDWPAPEGAVA